MPAERLAGAAGLPSRKQKNRSQVMAPVFIGGAEGIRTPDLLTASQARSQLRHSPMELPLGSGT